METFDLIIIGGGPGGYVCALEAAALGKRVALFEERQLGGTCLNRGCIPTKALLRASRVYHEAQESSALGITVQSASYDMAAIHSYIAGVTHQLREGIAALLARAKVTVVAARATLTAPGVVEAAGQSYTAQAVVVATGSSPLVPPILGHDLPGVLTSDQLLEDGGVDCTSLVIVGGGVVGVEFAQVYSRLGCAVTILEGQSRLLPGLDREIGQNLGMIFKKQGIQIATDAMVSSISRQGDDLCCSYTDKKGEPQTVTAQKLLLCIGRRPNTAGLFPADMAAGLAMVKGYLPVDDHLQTHLAGLYAIGDVVLGGTQLAHAAEAQGRNLAHLLFGGQPPKNADLIPGCVFTEPEIATVGLTADQAKEQGRAVRTVKNLTSANGKSVVEGADRGFVKLVIDAENDRLLGAQLMCTHAGEMLGGLTAAIGSGMTHHQLESAVFPHPTVSETIIG